MRSHRLEDWLRSVRVGLNPETYFRQRADQRERFVVYRDTGVRARLADELSTDPAPHEMPKLPYLSAIIKETLRMHPAVPIVLRKLLEPRSIGGIQFSAGDVVGIAVPALHFRASIWPDPERFDPDRFLDHNPAPFEYLPFGGGHRRCLGAAFATYELAIAIGTMVRTVVLSMPQAERRKNPPTVGTARHRRRPATRRRAGGHRPLSSDSA